MSKTYIPVALRRQVVVDFAERCAYCRSPEYLLDSIYEVDSHHPGGGWWIYNPRKFVLNVPLVQ